ncbi:unnamed protein product, partial [Rotaria sp. Silwood1]
YKKSRSRDLGIPFTDVTDKSNSITDVEGVTTIFPRGFKNVFRRMPCFANWFSLNGDGAMTGVHYLTERGFLTAPILITNTNSVGICQDSLIK